MGLRQLEAKFEMLRRTNRVANAMAECRLPTASASLGSSVPSNPARAILDLEGNLERGTLDLWPLLVSRNARPKRPAKCTIDEIRWLSYLLGL